MYICPMLKRRVQQFIEEKSLFAPDDKVLVALSGGADSVALLHVLVSLGYRCECAHCNFHLRGEESDRDERFVRLLCEKMSVKLHVVHFQTKEYAAQHHLSIEMAARELRYNWFEELCKEHQTTVIAVAHHRDDSVETVLLNLIRGTGINGLKGISCKNGRVVRPLLQESREAILDYLEHVGQDYVTDSTNLQDEYMRNKIRLNILPMMREMNPSVADSIFETSRRLSEVADVYHTDRQKVLYEKLVEISKDMYRMDIAEVLSDVAPMSLLFEALSPFGFNDSQIKDVYRCMVNEQSGKRFFTQNWEVLRDRYFLFIHRKEKQSEMPKLIIEVVEMSAGFVMLREKGIAYLDADKVKEPLVIRHCKTGDWFVPFGMTGRKKMSDYMTDRKFSLLQKENQCVVCDGDNIVWLVKERSDNRYRITPQTKRVMILKIDANND